MKTSLIEKFLSKVRKTDTCWEWTGRKFWQGYGAIDVKIDGKYYGRKAHRVSYELFVGPIPFDLNVCHLCDNRGCVNPEHLVLGTQQQNMIDCVNKMRHVYGERHKDSRYDVTTVKLIRFLASLGNSRKEIADWIGGAPQSVGDIINRKYWKHVE